MSAMSSWQRIMPTAAAGLVGERLGWSTVHNRIEDGNIRLIATVSPPFRTNGRKTLLSGSFSCTFTGTHYL